MEKDTYRDVSYLCKLLPPVHTGFGPEPFMLEKIKPPGSEDLVSSSELA